MPFMAWRSAEDKASSVEYLRLGIGEPPRRLLSSAASMNAIISSVSSSDPAPFRSEKKRQPLDDRMEAIAEIRPLPSC